MSGPNKNGTGRDVLRALSLFTQLGLTMAVCVGLGVWIGGFLDRRLGTSPVLLLVLAFVGAIAAFKVMYDMVIKEHMK